MPLLTAELLRSLPPLAQDIADTRVPGFLVRCRPTGVHSFLVRLGRGNVRTLGRVGVMSVAEAREEARKELAARDMGLESHRSPGTRLTLDGFLSAHYGPWVRSNRKTGAEIEGRIRTAFPTLLPKPLSDLTVFALEKWRLGRKQAGTSPVTINRDISDLRAALAHAVRWRLVKSHPFAELRPYPVDSRGVVRFLSAQEQAQLLAALTARDDDRRHHRGVHIQWMLDRGHTAGAAYGTFTDHLHPLVLVALHTGLRRGELFGLTWADVDTVAGQLTVRGANAKSGRTRYVELNREAVRVLTTWRADRNATLTETARASDLVFPGRAGGRLDNIQSSWEQVVSAAGIEKFRFHDLRHTFASRLVQAGVDLNTVRELLGHADTKMTLRYAHLSPDHRRAAVDKLVSAQA